MSLLQIKLEAQDLMNKKKSAMNPFFFTIITLILLTVQAPARIGEDVWQLRSRYGKETHNSINTEGHGSISFVKNKLSIRAGLHAGKTVWITFSPTTLRKKELDFATARKLVEANQGPVKLELIQADIPSRYYVWEDKQKTRRASYDEERGFDSLIIKLTPLPEITPAVDDSKPATKSHVDGF